MHRGYHQAVEKWNDEVLSNALTGDENEGLDDYDEDIEKRVFF